MLPIYSLKYLRFYRMRFPSTIHVTFFAEKCLKMKVYALYYSEIYKNAQVSIYSLADLNIGHCVEEVV